MAGALTPLRAPSPRRVQPGGLGSAHCDVCSDLVLQYVTAGNDVVELQQAARSFGPRHSADALERLKTPRRVRAPAAFASSGINTNISVRP